MEQWKVMVCNGVTVKVSNLGRLIKPEQGYIGYRLGKAYSGVKKERVFKPYVAQNGYPTLALKSNGVRRKFLVHRIVASAFIPNPQNFISVNHIDGDKTNNCASNLEWCTLAYNTQQQWQTGLANLRGERNPVSKLREGDVREIRSTPKYVGMLTDLSRRFGVSLRAIEKVRNGESWKHVA